MDHNNNSRSADDDLARNIAAAEDLMKSMRLSQSVSEKSRLKARITELLDDAERIKKTRLPTSHSKTSTSGDAGSSKNIALLEPKVTRSLPKSEQILLLKSGYIADSKFPPWTKSPAASDFLISTAGSLFEDQTIFSLSHSQHEVFAGWRRPAAALKQIADRHDPDAQHTVSMQHSQPIDLVQDASTDCSVVASLCAIIARCQRGHSSLLKNVLFPWDEEASCPALSQNGKYAIKLNFNGCFRQLVVDDRLPSSKTDRAIHVVDRRNPTLLWPALIEKAYLKLHGGYDFPGSNSATDLWTITGWLPEQVFLQSDDLHLEHLWHRMYTSVKAGTVLITVGTGKMSSAVEHAVGLVGEHDYAVLDLQEVEGQRLMLIKNPWAEGPVWYRVPSRTSSQVDMHIRMSLPKSEAAVGLPAQSPRDLLNSDEKLTPGTFWMDIDNAAQYFESIYLNWSPGIFAFRQDLHFTWDLVDMSSRGLHASLSDHPQFSIKSAQGGAIWLLLCRHLQSNSSGKTQQKEVEGLGYICLTAYAADGKRIALPRAQLQNSHYIDSPQVLLKLDDCPPKSCYTIVATEQELPALQSTFTISAFSNSSVSLDCASLDYLHTLMVSAEWTQWNAGGNAHCIRYSTNPQFCIDVSAPTRIALLLEADSDELNVHVKLVFGRGSRIRSIQGRDVSFDSADYRRRCCLAESRGLIDPGKYTIICSTFDPDQFGTFKLVTSTDVPVKVKQLPSEDAGRFYRKSQARFPAGSTKIVASWVPRRYCNAFITASCKHDVPSAQAHLGLSIEQGQGPHLDTIATNSGGQTYADGTETALLDDFFTSPDSARKGSFWIVLTRVCSAEQAESLTITLETYVDGPDSFEIGQWSAIDE